MGSGDSVIIPGMTNANSANRIQSFALHVRWGGLVSQGSIDLQPCQNTQYDDSDGALPAAWISLRPAILGATLPFSTSLVDLVLSSGPQFIPEIVPRSSSDFPSLRGKFSCSKDCRIESASS